VTQACTTQQIRRSITVQREFAGVHQTHKNVHFTHANVRQTHKECSSYAQQNNKKTRVSLAVALLSIGLIWLILPDMSLKAVKLANASINLVGKRAIVVGGTSGIGTGIALRLARANVSVTIAGRNEERGQQVVEQMKQLGEGEHRFVQLNAEQLGSVKSFAEEYAKQNDKLDYLVMTQSIATIAGFTATSEGLDRKMSLHYYSRIALIDRLMPLLANSQDARVLSVLSGGVHSPYAK
jgi:hypothetical protein